MLHFEQQNVAQSSPQASQVLNAQRLHIVKHRFNVCKLKFKTTVETTFESMGEFVGISVLTIQKYYFFLFVSCFNNFLLRSLLKSINQYNSLLCE